LPLAAASAVNVVVVDEFHWVKRRVRIQPMKTKASTTRPMARARSRRDSRFICLNVSIFRGTFQ
jgi:replicative superfamily II helicase